MSEPELGRIEPDTKDWTWVLQRPCPECGTAAGAMVAAEVPDLLRGYAQRWAEVLRRPGVAARPEPTVWSPLEYGCHVRDVCRLMQWRARLMLAEDFPTFPNWDQDATALAERYGERCGVLIPVGEGGEVLGEHQPGAPLHQPADVAHMAAVLQGRPHGRFRACGDAWPAQHLRPALRGYAQRWAEVLR